MPNGDSERWVPFAYRDFYDVPRMIVFLRSGRCYLLDCTFDSELDDYRSEYDVFVLSFTSLSELPDSWEHLARDARQRLGSVSVEALRFDETRRHYLDGSIVDRIH
jgi:hypothetical protein